jgi:hypothetical protein
MNKKTRKEILEIMRDAGTRNARVEFMRIAAKHPIDFASAMDAFLDGLKAWELALSQRNSLVAGNEAAQPAE